MNDYPPDWQAIALAVKVRAGWSCIRCCEPHHPSAGYCLTVHHADGDKANCLWWNLLALCQRCHLSIQGRVVIRQQYPFEHSPWFKLYAAGWYALTYLGRHLTQEQTAAQVDVLLRLERRY